MTATRETPLARWRSSRGASAAISADWLGCSAPLPMPARQAATDRDGRRRREGEAAVAARQSHAGADRRGAGADPVDHRSRDRRYDDGDPADEADDEAREAEAEARAPRAGR